jgi:hypothetical protein
MKYNIFQGNDLLLKQVADSLGYEYDEDSYYSPTDEIYFQAFFYLTQRFGLGVKYDKYKDAAIWDFQVDEYTIRIHQDSSQLSFIIFGDAKHKNLSFLTPFIVKKKRFLRDYGNLFIDMYAYEHTNENILNEQWDLFCKKEGIEDWTEEMMIKEGKDDLWIDWVQNYNENLIGTNWEAWKDKYGQYYENRQTRKALRVLDKFLKNMLSPIYIRDVAYNIKGEWDYKYEKYCENIEIKYIKN